MDQMMIEEVLDRSDEPLTSDHGLHLEYEERLSDSPLIEKVWHTQSELDTDYTGAADGRWDLMILRHNGSAQVMVTGPMTSAQTIPHLAGSDWLGIRFKLGVVMPHLPASQLVDDGVSLPEASGASFWLKGAAWQLPDFENADTCIDQLMRADLLTYDPLVEDVLSGSSPNWSTRSIQYRFQRVTGLTQKAIQQIERARLALTFLEQGCSILDTVEALGYFDQAHLTNSLKRYAGRTPAQIVRTARAR